MARTVRRPRLRPSLKSRLLHIFWLIIISKQNTFRTRRVRQNKPQEAEGDDHEFPDDEEVVELLDDEDAEVVKVNERKRKKENNK